MPEAKARRRRKIKHSTPPVTSSVEKVARQPARPARVSRRQAVPLSQGLVMDGMVALGCWGMAASFAFFTNDPNRYLFAGLCLLMALMWSFRFGMRLRKSMQQAK